MARIPFTYNAYEVWVNNGGSYNKRTTIGYWWTRPTEEELQDAAKLAKVHVDEISVLNRGGAWYRLFRRPIKILGVPPLSEKTITVTSHLVWPVPNEDKTFTGMFYVHRSECATIQELVRSGCTLKLCTVNDTPTDEYLLKCPVTLYESLCKRNTVIIKSLADY